MFNEQLCACAGLSHSSFFRYLNLPCEKTGPQTHWLRETEPGPASEPELWEKEECKQLRSGGSVSSGPLPLINHSNYLPQLQECAGRAAPWPLPRWEALRRLGGSTNTSQLTHMETFRKPTSYRPYLICGDARNLLNSFPSIKPVPPPPLALPTLPLWFHLHFGICQNWVSQTVCQRATFILPGLYGIGAKSPSHAARSLETLSLLCSALAGSCTPSSEGCPPVPAWAGRARLQSLEKTFNVNSCSTM